MVSGGPNGGPQYNPANVSGTGGAGQSGDYTGFEYGKNKDLRMQRQQGNQAVATTKTADVTAPTTPYEGINLSPIGTFMDPTTDNLPITAGVDIGGGPGSDALPNMFKSDARQNENVKIAMSYLPDLSLAAQSPNAPDSYKRFVNYLIQNVNGVPYE
tara:strand:- start:6015 stop:6485 length:471 start_codon:yes stop_codon:yes gene_type:complete